MIGRTTWTLLLVGTLLASAGAATAVGHYGLDLDLGSTDIYTHGGVGECSGGELTLTGDFRRDAVLEETREQEVDVDDDDVLLAIALANNGATGIDWNTIRDVELTETSVRRASQTADLEREDVFSALALGVDAHNGALDALVCISDFDFEQRLTRTFRRSIDLEEDDVLLAIALENSVGGGLHFDDIADIRESDRLEIWDSRTVDVDREDAFLALALGAGG